MWADAASRGKAAAGGPDMFRTRREKEDEMAYPFMTSGAGPETCRAADSVYPGIQTPADLYDALKGIWGPETCAPRMRDRWTEENPTWGQCSVTAFLAQDIFGGEVFGIPLKDGSVHCFNRVGECVFDLTGEQFGAEKLNYEDCSPQKRENHFAKEEKRLRYELLKAKLEAACRGRQEQAGEA